MNSIENRIRKNQKRLNSWVKTNNINAYRIYDRDIPDYPYMIDRYANYFVVHKRIKEIDLEPQKAHHFEELLAAVQRIYSAHSSKIIIKDRRPEKFKLTTSNQWNASEALVVTEFDCKFYVNLTGYLDTGLFLDHRPLRRIIAKKSAGKHLLNLFAYTGSISIASAINGGSTTSVDLSKTYQKWTQANFQLNQMDPSLHSFANTDAREFLINAQEKTLRYDLIVLDPPTFSNSKKTEVDFDVERDHEELIDLAMSILHQKGELYFSTNKRKFKLAPLLAAKYNTTNITEISLPRDYHDKKCHRCYRLTLK